MKKVKIEVNERIYKMILEELKSAYREAYFTDEQFDKYTDWEMKRLDEIFTALGITQEQFDKI